ncbi:MAG: hypothetical protein K0S65_5303 [Labilithrix sp.]|nr:hypothetical protein [Labilithrix sp.]
MLRGDVLEPYLERLRALPFVREARVLELKPTRRAEAQPDAEVLVRTPAGRTTLAAELKRTHLSREAAERLLHLRRASPIASRGVILFAPLVGRELAERFGRAQLNFVDLAGNCHLQIDERYLAHIEGRRPESHPTSLRALRAPTYQVLFALLVKPDLVNAPARVLAEAAGGVSPQTAIDARTRLHEQGLLVGSSKAPKWSLNGRKGALDLLIAGVARPLAPSLASGRYRARERDTARLEITLASRLNATTTWRWGGGAACQRLTGDHRGETTIIYVDRVTPTLASELELVADRNGPISICRRPTPLAFESPTAETVHPLLAYLDLLAEGGERASDAAGEIASRYLEEPERERE